MPPDAACGPATPAARRLFVALTPPPDARAALAAAAAPLLDACGPAARRVAPELLHLTLRFLGDAPAERLPALCDALGAAAGAGPPLVLAPAGAGAFPSPARPQVLWLGVAPNDALGALAARVDAACAAAGFGREARAFRAHVTVARVRRGARVDAAALGAAAASVRAPAPFAVATLDLVASTLTPAGPRYEAVARLALGAPGGERWAGALGVER